MGHSRINPELTVVGSRVSEIRESTMDALPACVTRLIEDCCRAEPKERLADMPAVIERIELARTILSSRTSEAEAGVAEARVEAEEETPFEHSKEVHAAGFDPVAEALGLKPDGFKAIDFDDSTPVG